MPKNRVLTSVLPSFEVKVKGWVKVKGRGQGHAQGQRLKPNFWRTAVDIRGSALLSAAKSKEESLSVRGLSLCVA